MSLYWVEILYLFVSFTAQNMLCVWLNIDESVLQEQAKLRMMKEKGSDKTDMFWNNLWGKPKDLSSGIACENTKDF